MAQDRDENENDTVPKQEWRVGVRESWRGSNPHSVMIRLFDHQSRLVHDAGTVS